MKKFEDQIDGGISITANEAEIHLTPHEAYALWQWLSARKDAFRIHTNENQVELEIHLYQEDLSHLDELKAIIPDLQEREPVAKILDARLEAVSEQALKLLKQYQIEFNIHPLLEDDDVYAQG
jgi:arsenate reductase-like glutaredoxin family protein